MFFKIGVNFNKVNYHLLWINPQMQKKELFIHFISTGEMRKIKIPSYKDGEIIDETNYFDHLSFHSDGKIHIRHKSNGKKKEYTRELKTKNIYDYPLSEVLTILSNTYLIKDQINHFKVIDDLKYTYIFNVSEQPFTLLVFLVSKTNANSFMNEYVKRMFNVIQNPFLIDLGDNAHYLLIVMVSDIPIELNNGFLDNQVKLLRETKNIQPFISYGILPSIEFMDNGLVPPEDFITNTNSKNNIIKFRFRQDNNISADWCIWEDEETLGISVLNKDNSMAAFLGENNDLQFTLGKQNYSENNFSFIPDIKGIGSCELIVDKGKMQNIFHIIIPVVSMSSIPFQDNNKIETIAIDLSVDGDIIVSVTHIPLGKHNLLKADKVINHMGSFCKGRYIVSWDIKDSIGFSSNMDSNSNAILLKEGERQITAGCSPNNTYGLFLDAGNT